MLVDLGMHPNPDDVDAILGTDSSTRTQCNYCGECGVDVLKIERRFDPFPTFCGGGRSLHLCKKCLREAVEFIDGVFSKSDKDPQHG
jgi:hypothetical protein